MANTAKILGKKVKIEKKMAGGGHLNFKISVGREVYFFSTADDPRYPGWYFSEKKFFLKGDDIPLTPKEQEEILSFVKFLLVFRAYEYTLISRRNFSLEVEETEKEKSEGYSDYDYRKEVKLNSFSSLWGSESNLHLFCQFVGHVTNEGGNEPLGGGLYLDSTPFFHMTLEATPESMKKRLGQVIDPIVIDANNKLATMWFIYKILPTYYMLAFI